MKTLDRYIAQIFVRNVLVAVLGMASLFLFQALFSDIYDQDYTLHQILTYQAMSIPKIVVEMSPPSILLATVLTLSGMVRTHELVACYTIGVSLRRIMTLILGIVLIVSSSILFMEDRVLPHFFRIQTNYYWRQMKKRPDFFLDIKRDKIWYRSKNMIYNLQRFDNQSKTIHGMSVYTFDDGFNLTQVIGAEKAQFDQKKWNLLNGTVTVFTEESPFPLTQNFKEKTVIIAETPKEFQEIEKEVNGLNFKELDHYIQKMKNAGANTHSYEVKYHSRFSLSFIPIVMCFLAIPFSTRSRREGGMGKDLGICLLMTFSYWLFYSIGLSLGTNGAIPPWLGAWLPSGAFLSLAGVLISRKHAYS